MRWVDTNKGSEAESDVRCRLVARDFRQKRDKGREDLFAETPPLEAIRMQLSKAVTRRMRGSKRGCRKIMFIDAKKAHLNPRCEEDVYIELPEEAGHEEGMCGKLRHWLYGFRRAAQAWEEFYSKKFQEEGFERGEGSGVIYYHRGRDVSCVCHGDDFTLVGEEWELKRMAKVMEK